MSKRKAAKSDRKPSRERASFAHGNTDCFLLDEGWFKQAPDQGLGQRVQHPAGIWPPGHMILEPAALVLGVLVLYHACAHVGYDVSAGACCANADDRTGPSTSWREHTRD